MAFSYNGVHADALKNARNWNRKNYWPTLVLWWVNAGHVPQWAEAVPRLERLNDQGLGPEAFSFKQPYTADGSPVLIDRVRVKSIVLANEAGQRDLLAQIATLPV